MTKIEFRIRPEGTAQDTRRGLKALLLACSELARTRRMDVPVLGFSVHFLKPEVGISYSDFFFGPVLRQWWPQMESLVGAFLDSPALTHFVRGLDVAGREAAVPTWVVSHVYNEFRRRVRRSRDASAPPLRYTAHLGEETQYIVDGLRRVYEGVVWLGLTPGDRLGHATAVGVKADKLLSLRAKSDPACSLPAFDHLDDLVWVWGIASDITRAPVPPDHVRDTIRRYLPDIEGIIRTLAERIYGYGLTPHNLWQAYQLRFSREALEEAGVFHLEGDGRAERVELVPKSDLPQAPTMHTNDSLRTLCTYLLDVDARREGAQQITPDLARLSLSKWLPAVQEWLADVLARRGVSVETCPTSNVLICGLEDYRDHPIFRFWPPPGAETTLKVSASVSTDDPLPLATCLENELALLFAAYQSSDGLRAADATGWIASIAEEGASTSFLPRMSSNSDLEERLSLLSRCIDDL